MNTSYHIITIGCQMNKSDSERIANVLDGLGFNWTDDSEDASVLVLTTCGVRQSAENRVYSLIANIKKNNPKTKIILTGCLSKRPDVRSRLKDIVDIWLPITELDSLGEKLGFKKKEESSLSGYLKIQPKYSSTFSAFVPIGNGCDNFCTYCVVPHARGRETYRAAEEIISEAKDLIKRGYKEITLIAQNVNSYRSTINNSQLTVNNAKEVNFAKLLKLVNDLPGEFWLRYSTSHPKDMSDELIETMAQCGKLCRHVHLPVQAGDNEILRRMNRKYTVDHYVQLIEKIRKKLNIRNSKFEIRNWQAPVSISTDIIVGFPGETEEQFNKTADLFRKIKFDMAYLSQYSPRPGTAAEKMVDDVTREEKKRREEFLNDILSETALENNQVYLDNIVDVLVDDKKGKNFIGKTKGGKTIRVLVDDKEIGLIGEIVRVKITEVEDFGMKGELT